MSWESDGRVGAGDSDIEPDDERVGEELEPVKIDDLPTELLLQITEHVLKTSKKDLAKLLRCCRQFYAVGLPVLYSNVAMGDKSATGLLRSLGSSLMGLEKTSLVKTLVIRPGLQCTGTSLGVLAKCLLNVTSVTLNEWGEDGRYGGDFFPYVWKLLQNAPGLVELSLNLAVDHYDWIPTSGVWPPSVRVFNISLNDDYGLDEFWTMLDERVSGLTELSILSFMDAYPAGLSNHPSLEGKIRRLKLGIEDLQHLPGSVTDLTLRCHSQSTEMGFTLSSSTVPESAWSHLGRLENVVSLT